MLVMAPYLALVALCVAVVAANPTHYGDPKGGCMSDEQAVRVQGLSGDFCSPPCTSSGSCPSDLPSGDSAKPTCALQTTTGGKYCALICSPSAARANGTNGECGTGTCQSIQGIGICTYDVASGAAVEAVALPPAEVSSPEPVAALEEVANPTHYGDPKDGCMSDEQAVRVQGLSGDFCSPQCTSAGSCPTDLPSGDTAKPTCALRTTTGGKYCALICSPSAAHANGTNGECGSGTCESIQGMGICTYDAAGGAAVDAVAMQPAVVAMPEATANPTHYGDPKGGCESDEQAVRVQGLSGDFCSPQCTSAGSCPSDVPSGDTAAPTCALRTTTGGKYCALICSPSTANANGTSSECGTGTCQSIQGTGICTYDAAGSSALGALAAPPSLELVVAPEAAASANPTHYGDPKEGCMSDEQAVRVQGLSGDFCSPQCTSAGSCPTDLPSGDTAKPQCALQTTTGGKYCALLCSPSVAHANSTSGQCGTGTCQSIQGLGICTYAAAGGAAIDALAMTPSSPGSVLVI